MAVSNVNASNDGSLYLNNADYATVRNASVASSLYTTGIFVGQDKGAVYAIYRGFLTFAIPEMSDITSCVLHLDGSADYSTTDFDLYIVSSTYSNPLVLEDYDLIGSTPYNDTWNSSSYSAGDNALTFNATGLAAVLAAQGTSLRFALRSKKDVDATAPTNIEALKFTAGQNAYLTITYTEPPIEETVEATGEGGVEVGISLTHPIEATGEGEVSVGIPVEVAGGIALSNSEIITLGSLYLNSEISGLITRY